MELSARLPQGDERAQFVLFVTTGYQRMLNMIETLRWMLKPNRSAHDKPDMTGEVRLLLNKAWRVFWQSRRNYVDWEQRAVARL